MNDLIYLDNNATTAVTPPVAEAMQPYWTLHYGNPGSLHQLGTQARQAVSQAREQVAALAGVSAGEIVFTSGGTESNNTAIRAALAAQPDRNEVVISAIEHPAVLRLCEHLAKNHGIALKTVGVDAHGQIDPQAVADAITPDTALVSIMAANNETGVRLPFERIAEICAEQGVAFHTDAVQLAGKEALGLGALPVSFAAFSSHKFHGPKGVGALVVRRGARFSPLIIGGGQESRRRGGTEPVPLIVGMGAAAAEAQANLDDVRTRVAGLRDRLEQAITAGCPSARILAAAAERLPNTCTIAFRHMEAEPILISLDRVGVCVSSGSACSSGSSEPSHVLRAMNVSPEYLRGAIRFSLSRLTTPEQIDRAANETVRVIAKLKRLFSA